MCRAFLPTDISDELIDGVIDAATQAPSAGHAQGLHVVVLVDEAREKLWGRSLAPARRSTFRWQGLLQAPVLLLIFTDPSSYVARYAEADKQHTDLGEGTQRWTTPFWTVDAGMAVMSMLLHIESLDLGALFFAFPEPIAEIRAALGVPEHLETIGIVAFGHPDPASPDARAAGRSAQRPRRGASDVIHRGAW